MLYQRAKGRLTRNNQADHVADVWSHDLLGFKMASISDEGVILNGDFFLLAKKKSLHKVTLTRRRIFYSPDSYNDSVYEEKCIQISDIIGCHILDSRKYVTLPGVTLQSSSVSPSKISAYSNDQIEELNFPGQHFQSVYSPEACGIVIFAYPFKKKMFSDKRTRCRQVLALEISSSSTDTDGKRKEAEKWKNMINLLARDLPLAPDGRYILERSIYRLTLVICL